MLLHARRLGALSATHYPRHCQHEQADIGDSLRLRSPIAALPLALEKLAPVRDPARTCGCVAIRSVSLPRSATNFWSAAPRAWTTPISTRRSQFDCAASIRANAAGLFATTADRAPPNLRNSLQLADEVGPPSSRDWSKQSRRATKAGFAAWQFNRTGAQRRGPVRLLLLDAATCGRHGLANAMQGADWWRPRICWASMRSRHWEFTYGEQGCADLARQGEFLARTSS